VSRDKFTVSSAVVATLRRDRATQAMMLHFQRLDRTRHSMITKMGWAVAFSRVANAPHSQSLEENSELPVFSGSAYYQRPTLAPLRMGQGPAGPITCIHSDEN